MVMYFREGRKGGMSNRYTAVSETPMEHYDEPHHAAGEVEVTTSKEEFIPHWNTVSSEPLTPTHSYYHSMSRATGLSPQFLKHIHGVAGSSYSDENQELNESLDVLREYSNDNEWEHAVKTVKNHPLTNPDTLFTHVPKEVHIDSAFFDPSMRHTFPTVLGIIKQDFPEHKVTPSHDLSAHSSKLVQNAAKRGLLGENVPSEDFRQTNQLSFRERAVSGYRLANDRDLVRIPTEEVASARKGLKEMLFKSRGKTQPEVATHMSEQFSHPTLFD